MRSFARLTISEAVNKATPAQTDWYALYTRHQHEKSVAGLLCSKGFEVFLPLCRQLRIWSDRRKRIELPLFPCYLFVRANLDRKIDILATCGVHGFVGFRNTPSPIPPSEMEDLRRVVKLAEIEPHPFLRYGDWVRVKSGPFEGIEGVLVRRKGQARLVLSVEILQKSAAMEIDSALTERIFRPAVPRGSVLAEGAVAHISAVL